MPPNRILTTVLAGGIAVVAASTGYVIAQFTSASGHYVSQDQPAAGGDTGHAAAPSQGASGAAPAAPSAPSSPMAPSAAMPSYSPAGPGSGSAFDDPPLARYVAQKAGTGLAGKAPQNVPLSQVKALSSQVPAGASIDPRTNTITFHTTTVSFTVVAIAPGKPDRPAITGAFAGVIGDPTAAGDGANTVTFTAGDAGSYDYICPMPGHAQMGMHGSFTVR